MLVVSADMATERPDGLPELADAWPASAKGRAGVRPSSYGKRVADLK